MPLECLLQGILCEPISSINHVAHFSYSTLLDQFAAVSYGDQLFARFIMLPLQQRFSVHFRRMVWNDHSSIIRIFSLPLSQVSHFIDKHTCIYMHVQDLLLSLLQLLKVPVDVKHFLYPIETDGSLLEMYMSALASNNVRSAIFLALSHVRTHTHSVM